MTLIFYHAVNKFPICCNPLAAQILFPMSPFPGVKKLLLHLRLKPDRVGISTRYLDTVHQAERLFSTIEFLVHFLSTLTGADKGAASLYVFQWGETCFFLFEQPNNIIGGSDT